MEHLTLNVARFLARSAAARLGGVCFALAAACGVLIGCEEGKAPPLKQAEELHDKAEETLRASHEALEDAEDSLGAVSSQIVELKEKNVELEKTIATLRDEKASLEESLKETRESNDVLNRQLRETRQALTKAEEALGQVGKAAADSNTPDETDNTP